MDHSRMEILRTARVACRGFYLSESESVRLGEGERKNLNHKNPTSRKEREKWGTLRLTLSVVSVE
jgi:hypothetical protein